MRYICTTTISPPTDALKLFAKKEGWTLIVAGDLKTPHELYEKMDNVIYLHPDYQHKRFYALSASIGWNCIQRRNFAFLEAYERGADLIATVDDDNEPYPSWGNDLSVGKTIKTKVYTSNKILCFDPISVATDKRMWHRGFPIQWIKDRYYDSFEKEIEVDVQADFWNVDPDVDALNRLILNTVVYFNKLRFPFSTDLITPFNSQNTFMSREVLKEYFVFPHVGRMDDIWMSFYISTKYNILFSKPSVNQYRNEHDLTQNMIDEFAGYKNNYRLIEDLACNNNALFEKYLPKQALDSYMLYKGIMGRL